MYHVETRDALVRAPVRLIKCLLTPTNLPNTLREHACEQACLFGYILCDLRDYRK